MIHGKGQWTANKPRRENIPPGYLSACAVTGDTLRQCKPVREPTLLLHDSILYVGPTTCPRVVIHRESHSRESHRLIESKPPMRTSGVAAGHDRDKSFPSLLPPTKESDLFSRSRAPDTPRRPYSLCTSLPRLPPVPDRKFAQAIPLAQILKLCPLPRSHRARQG